MSMSVELMRDYLINKTKYAHSISWKEKVERMSDAQVIAVYMRLLSESERNAKLSV